MKWWNFRLALSAVALLPALAGAARQESEEGAVTDTVATAEMNRNERFEAKYRNFWSGAIPSYFKTQFAGSIGAGSVGIGWEYGHRHWETDLMVGLVPKCGSTRAKPTFTLRQVYNPWNIELGQVKGDYLELQPLRCALFLNTVYGEEFWTEEPSRYPSGYYNFSSRIRIGLSVGQSLTLHMDRNLEKYFFKNLAIYYELVTSDVYLLSAIPNRYLGFTDIVNLSVGIKWQFVEK